MCVMRYVCIFKFEKREREREREMPGTDSKRRRKKKKHGASSMFCIYTVVMLCMFGGATIMMSWRISLPRESSTFTREAAWLVESHQEHDVTDICTSEDYCHCYKTKQKCLCLFGTKIGEDCMESGCNWHGPEEDTDKYRSLRKHHHAAATSLAISQVHGHDVFCDSCSASHCHGCSSKNACEDLDPAFGKTCKWIEGPNVDIEYCESLCSSSHCHACTSENECTQNIMCRWAIDVLDIEVKGDDVGILCLPRCDVHSCVGCASRSSCESANRAHGAQNAGCVWDTNSQICVKECVPAGFRDQYGQGCFTCETENLCEMQSHHGCSWNYDLNYCTNDDDQSQESAFYGDIVNPAEMLVFVEDIIGNVVIENDGTNIKEFDFFDGIKQVVGHIIIHDNQRLISMHLSDITLIHGNLEIMNNPNLKTIKINPSVELVGCLKLVGVPSLDSDSMHFLGRFRQC